MRGVPGIRGSPGYFSVRFYSLRGAGAGGGGGGAGTKSPAQSLPNRNGEFGFRLAGASVDLRTGIVSVAADAPDVVQNLCLAFSVAVLYVLCQPRPVRAAESDGPAPADDPAKMSPRAVQKMETEGLELVVAAGYLYDTPCNSYIKCSVHAGACTLHLM